MNGISLLRRSKVRLRLKSIVMTLNSDDVPAMRKIMGFTKLFRPTVEAVVGRSVKDKEGRMHFPASWPLSCRSSTNLS